MSAPPANFKLYRMSPRRARGAEKAISMLRIGPSSPEWTISARRAAKG